MNLRGDRRLIFASALAVLTAVAFVPASVAAPGRPAQVGSARPVLHAISPTAVPVGGALIAVGGSRLNQVHSVSFGAIVVHNVHNVSSTRLTVRAPKHALGRVAVRLHSASGASQPAHLNYVPAPAPLHWHADPGIDPRRGELSGLSCATENFCVAVEHDPNTPTRLLRFGTHIAPKSTSVPESADVRDVACGTNHFCVAGPANGAYIWNGSRWRGPVHLGSRAFERPPVCAPGTTTCVYASYAATTTLVHRATGWVRVPPPPGVHIDRLSCASATFCGALSANADGSGDQFVRYNGSSWQVDNPPPSVGVGYGYGPIACVAPAYCLAIGRRGSAELNGATWTAAETIPAQHGSVIGFECGAPGHCVALGQSTNEAATFSGGHWTEAGVPDNGAPPTALSCPTAAVCRAADDQGRTFDLTGSSWSATRQLVQATGHLRDISCATRDWCMAIDHNGNALRWQHRHWSAPMPIDLDHALVAISCAPDRTCIAVTAVQGPSPDFQDHGRAIPYVDGRWQHPELIEPGGGFGDVSCPSSSYCAAVDGRGRVITWSHGSWSAPAQTADRSLGTIDCAAPEHCVAIGRGGTLILNGRSWHHVVAPGHHLALTRIDCVDPSFCVASTTQSVAELHAGVWAQLTVENHFLGPSCASRTLCVGDADKPSGWVDETFNGSASRPSPYHNAKAISCTPGPVCVELTNSAALVGRP
jgi:hypothetical protein